MKYLIPHLPSKDAKQYPTLNEIFCVHLQNTLTLNKVYIDPFLPINIAIATFQPVSSSFPRHKCTCHQGHGPSPCVFFSEFWNLSTEHAALYVVPCQYIGCSGSFRSFLLFKDALSRARSHDGQNCCMLVEAPKIVSWIGVS